MEFSRQEYWNGCHFLLQGIFLTQGSKPGLLHCRQVLYHLSYREVPLFKRHHQIRLFRHWTWLLVLRLWPFNKILSDQKSCLWYTTWQQKTANKYDFILHRHIYVCVYTHIYMYYLYTYIEKGTLHIIYIYVCMCKISGRVWNEIEGSKRSRWLKA